MSKYQITTIVAILTVFSLFIITSNAAYGQLEEIKDIEDYFGIDNDIQEFTIVVEPSRFPITHQDRIEINGNIPDTIKSRNVVIFLNVTYPDGNIINLKTITNNHGSFYIPYILEQDEYGIAEGTYNIHGWFEEKAELFSTKAAFWAYDKEKEDPTKKIIKINKGSAISNCDRKDQCFNPSTSTFEKSALIEFQNFDKETHYIEGIDAVGKTVFSTGVLISDEKHTVNSKRLDAGPIYIHCKYHPWIQGAINLLEQDQEVDEYIQTTIQSKVSKKIVESVSVAGFTANLESDKEEYSMGNIVRIALILNENTKLSAQTAIYGPENFLKIKNIKVNENTGVGFIEFLVDSSHTPGDYIVKTTFSKGIERIALSTGFAIIENNDNIFCQGDQGICFGGNIDRIIDGDTLVIEQKKVRLSLIDTPEKDEPGFANATEFTKSFCPQSSLAFVDIDDLQKKDTYGRTLGVVLCNEKNLNEALLKNDHAVIATDFCGKSEFTNSTWAQEYGCDGVDNSNIIDDAQNEYQNPFGLNYGGGCLIATATYGTELAPQVQELRELRSSLITTKSGAGFIESFNILYYSFSPAIADIERENEIFREMIKIGITPMLSMLSLLNHFNLESELEVLVYGITIIIAIAAMYSIIPGVAAYGIIKKLRKKENVSITN